MPSARRARPANRLQFALLLFVLVLAGWWQLRQRQDAPGPTIPPAATPGVATPGAANEEPAGVSRDDRAVSDRHDLSIDETRGGHTLARHVGRSDADLRARLERETNISAASTYTDRATAERTVARTLAASAARVAAWRNRQGSRPNLALDYRGSAGEVLGRSLERGRQSTVPAINAVVVLRWDNRRGFDYVLTSYPEARRR